MTHEVLRKRSIASQAILRAPRVDGGRVTARLSLGSQDFDLFFETSEGPPAGSQDAFVVASLLLAMKAGTELVVEGPVSERLLSSLPQAQTILSAWEPRFRPIEVRAETYALSPRAAGTGVFFSLGVDSFYTLREEADELTHLIMVKGYDPARLDDALWDAIFANARRVASASGKRLIEVRTNLSDFARVGVSWKWLHGPALAAAGHVLSETLGAVHISASQRHDHLGPWGSHPSLDPLWSSDRLEVIHSGAALDRVEKTALLSGDPLVLETLRVCLASDGHEYNCGRCPKCLGAMLVLDAADTLTSCRTLPDQIDPAAIHDLNLNVGNRIYYFEAILSLLQRAGRDPELIQALRHRIRRSRFKTTPLGSLVLRTRDLLRSASRKSEKGNADG
jgi:hypothetical protein